jgi:hypothetical protein
MHLILIWCCRSQVCVLYHTCGWLRWDNTSSKVSYRGSSGQTSWLAKYDSRIDCCTTVILVLSLQNHSFKPEFCWKHIFPSHFVVRVFTCNPLLPSVVLGPYRQSTLVPLLVERSWRITVAVMKAIGPWVLIETYYSMPLTQQAGHADPVFANPLLRHLSVVMSGDIMNVARTLHTTLLYLFLLPFLILFIFYVL